MTQTGKALDMGFIQRVLFVIVAIAASLLVFKLLGLWLLIFGAIVIATVLRALAEPLIKYTPLNDTLAVLTVLVVVLGFIAVTFTLFGYELTQQTQNLTKQLPAAWEALQARLKVLGLNDEVQQQLSALGQQAGGLTSKIPLIAGSVFSSLANLLVATIAGIILAINPNKYRDGVVFLFSAEHKERVRDAMNVAGHALRLWFVGQFISMVLVGTLTAVGLSILGVPSALALGMVSGLAQFVPIVGPVVSAGPGLLLAAVSGWQVFIWALVIYVGVSQLESNIITPAVQRRIASIPVIVTLFAVIGFAGLLGPMGVLFAMPLTVIIYTLIRRLYAGEDVTELTDEKPQRPARKPRTPKAS
ncbi:hypothetical protein AEAC466_03265 [Asticcacaulis sp. AC466]|uniref:AI-2E family transporter n=1 Tax=Asticcacaulis sp. AC466 TaxID=1282362 RepID=UPI0003C3B4A4|nr:AI-2E family transporter [Asticcacaulis sp. AC466]ESQ86229.1 hypothetical protein AEAC466_03265 [Asticcacaulis sp. AC466]